MPQRAVAGLALVVVALLTFGAWFLLRERGSEPDAVTTTGAARTAAAEADAAPPLAVAAPAPEPEREVELPSDATLDEASLLPPITEAELAPEPEFGIVVEVIEPGGRPSADAEMAWIDAADRGRRELLTDLSATSPSAGVRVHRYRTDERGRATVERPIESALVLACRGPWRGVVTIASTDFTPVPLLLGPPLDLLVRVVDEAGAPREGVDVAAAGNRNEIRRPQLVATTDSTGIAELVGVDLALTAREPTRRAFVALHHPLGTSRSGYGVDVELPPATSPVTLTLPATGSVELQLVDARGEALARPGRGSLRITAERGRSPSFRFSVDEHGHATLRHVGLGLHFSVDVDTPEFQSRPAEFDGPKQEGEVVEVTLARGPRGPILTGLALDERGAPLADHELSASLVSGVPQFERPRPIGGGGPFARRVATKSDDHGKFALDWSGLDRELRGVMLRLEIEAAGEPALVATERVTLPDSGEDDLGEIRFEPPPLLAQGEVRDDSGTPVADARLRLSVRNDPVHGIPADGLRTEWSGRSGADGRFELRGFTSAPALSIAVSRPDLVSLRPREIPVGASGLLLEMVAGGAVTGSLRLDPSWRADLFRIVLTPEDPEVPVRPRTPEDDGSFGWRLCPPGLATVSIQLRTDPGEPPLLEVAGVRVEPRQVTADPRLQQIDVSRWVRSIAISVVDENSTPFRDGSLRIVETGMTAHDERRLRGEPIPYLTARAALDVVAAAPHHRPVRRRVEPGESTLALAPALVVELAIAAGEGPDGLVPRVVTVTSSDELFQEATRGDRTGFADGVARVELPGAGSFTATVTFGAAELSTREAARRRDLPRRLFDFHVRELAGSQRVTLSDGR